MPWIKWDTEYDEHPEVITLGWEAKALFPRLVMHCKRYSTGGALEPRVMTAEYQAAKWGCPVEVCEQALADLAKSSLVIVSDDGSWFIPGYERKQSLNNSERARKWRREKACDSTTCSEPEQDATARTESRSQTFAPVRSRSVCRDSPSLSLSRSESTKDSDPDSEETPSLVPRKPVGESPREAAIMETLNAERKRRWPGVGSLGLTSGSPSNESQLRKLLKLHPPPLIEAAAIAMVWDEWDGRKKHCACKYLVRMFDEWCDDAAQKHWKRLDSRQQDAIRASGREPQSVGKAKADKASRFSGGWAK